MKHNNIWLISGELRTLKCFKDYKMVGESVLSDNILLFKNLRFSARLLSARDSKSSR